PRAIHFAHPSSTNRCKDLVRPEPGTRRESHRMLGRHSTRRSRLLGSWLSPPVRGSSGCGPPPLTWPLAALSLPPREAPPLWETPRAATGAGTKTNRNRSALRLLGRRLAAPDELDDLELVALGEGDRRIGGFRNDLAVALDGHAGRRDAKLFEEPGNGGACREPQRLAVDLNSQLSAHLPFFTGNLNSVEPMSELTRM